MADSLFEAMDDDVAEIPLIKISSGESESSDTRKIIAK